VRTAERRRVGNAGVLWKKLADADALGPRGYRAERPADLGRRVGLGVIGLEVSGTALEPDHEQRGPLDRMADAGARPPGEQPGQREAKGARETQP
jgi:hypothetical protein